MVHTLGTPHPDPTVMIPWTSCVQFMYKSMQILIAGMELAVIGSYLCASWQRRILCGHSPDDQCQTCLGCSWWFWAALHHVSSPTWLVWGLNQGERMSSFLEGSLQPSTPPSSDVSSCQKFQPGQHQCNMLSNEHWRPASQWHITITVMCLIIFEVSSITPLSHK